MQEHEERQDDFSKNLLQGFPIRIPKPLALVEPLYLLKLLAESLSRTRLAIPVQL